MKKSLSLLLLLSVVECQPAEAGPSEVGAAGINLYALVTKEKKTWHEAVERVKLSKGREAATVAQELVYPVKDQFKRLINESQIEQMIEQAKASLKDNQDLLKGTSKAIRKKLEHPLAAYGLNEASSEDEVQFKRLRTQRAEDALCCEISRLEVDMLEEMHSS